MMTVNVVRPGEVVIVLVELGLVEQRYQAVLEVLQQASSVTDVAVRFGVTRQTVHRWLRKYAADGIAGLVDGSAKPLSCPHQMPPVVEARIVELRRLNPGWGPRTIRFRLEAERVSPLPGRSSIYRCLVRHGLVEPEARRRKKADYKRWERSRAMELWQMDVVGGVQLVDGWRASITTGWFHSVAYLSALSLWALVWGHWSAWKAARVEVEQQREQLEGEQNPPERRMAEALFENTTLQPAGGDRG